MPKKKLGEFASTAICGNDISSSCLYVSALAIAYAGQYAWISLLVVVGVLYLFRSIYGEVVGALPLNGGAYNALLNTTSKSTASLAAALTLLSYMATAVISASEGMHYAHSLFGAWPVIPATIILLGVFMTLTIIGIGESSRVASVIFSFHILSLIVLTFFCGIQLLENGFGVLSSNFAQPVEGGVVTALFFGFCAAMLGISGFESSANFVEDQEEGVFPKTLKNMWVIVGVFNPLMAFLALALIPIPDVAAHQETLLSHLGAVSGGSWLSTVISVDAALVLSGAVLTSFVGVTGLVERMTLDRVLPRYLLKKNKRGSSYRIPIVFFLLCISVLILTGGRLKALAGVYTLAFLSVMVLFGMGNFLLKVRRKNLPRPERSTWIGLIVAMAGVLAALVGNAIMNPSYVGVFLEYLIPTLLITSAMLMRTRLLKFILRAINYFFNPIESYVQRSNQKIRETIDEINAQEFIYFTRDDDVAILNRVMRYVEENEHTKKIKVVTVLREGEVAPPRLASDIDVLDREYPMIDIDFVQINGEFGPDLIHELSQRWNIPINFMFISSIDDSFPYKISELGGVRLII